jgi:hypothetical protein
MSFINFLIAAATRETRILSEGLSSLADRASFLAAARRASTATTNTTNLNSTRISRIATRAKIDLALAVPWVPILAVVPGSAFLMAFASAVAPITLPSTFTAARTRIIAASLPQRSSSAAETQLRKSVLSAGLTRRVDSEAQGEAALRPLGIRAVKSVANQQQIQNSCTGGAAVLPVKEAAIHFNDTLILDDAALRIQEALKEGPFAEGENGATGSAADEAQEACSARGLLVNSNFSNVDMLHAWLSLRCEFPPAQLYAALTAAAAGSRITD